MSKYAALGAHLHRLNQGEVSLTFANIAQIIGFALPKARLQSQWWSDPSGPITRALFEAGFRADKVDVAAGTVTFKRLAADVSGRGLFDLARSFAPAKAVP